MKLLLGMLLMTFSAGAMAEEYYYLIDSTTDDPAAAHYPSADAACRVIYATDIAKHAAPADMDTPLPYAPPTLAYSVPPKFEGWTCNVSWTDSKNGDGFTHGYSVTRFGDGCTADQVYNPLTGNCESPDKEQDRRELGDPGNPISVGFVSCGDPVSPANGNVFESETDYADQDGELRFVRSYNSRDMGTWVTTLDTHLYPDTGAQPRSAVVRFSDGRTALFIAKDGTTSLSRTLDAHLGNCADCFQSKRHVLAVDRVGLVHEVGQQTGKTTCILKPLCGRVHQVVRCRFGIDVVGDAAIYLVTVR